MVFPHVVVYDYPQGSNTGGYFYPRVRLPPGGYNYTTGVRVPPGTPTLPGYDYPHTQGDTPTLPGQDYPPVLLPCQGTITPIHRGYSYPARAGLPPVHLSCQGTITPHTKGGTPTLHGQDYPPVLLPCQGKITPRYSYPARVRLPPLHRGVLLPC